MQTNDLRSLGSFSSSAINRPSQGALADLHVLDRNIQLRTQVFLALYTSGENVFIGALVDSGKTVCAEFALLRLTEQA